MCPTLPGQRPAGLGRELRGPMIPHDGELPIQTVTEDKAHGMEVF